MVFVKLTVLIMPGDEADCVPTRFLWSISIPLSRRRRKQCRECRECSPIRKVPTEIPVEVFRKGYTAYIAYISRLSRVGCHAIEGRLRNGVGRPPLTIWRNKVPVSFVAFIFVSMMNG